MTTSSKLYLLEPEDAGTAWAPFAGARPIADLRAGAWLIRERWSASFQLHPTGIITTSLSEFVDTDPPLPIVAPNCIIGPAIVVASWCAPTGAPLAPDRTTRRLTCEEQTVAWLVPAGEAWGGPSDPGPAESIDGVMLRQTSDLLNVLDRLLAADCANFLAETPDPIPGGSIVIGDPADLISLGATIEPGVVFDLRKGCVVLHRGVEVRSGARLEGPLFVGPGTFLLGGTIRNSAIGPHCRVHGEVSSSVFLGYANKSHDGFVGHSIVGQWVNLGAGTITSNLKNTYGDVRLDVGASRLDTGRMNVGTLFGDHVKTAIGTLLATGTVIGAGANVFGAPPVPKYVAPFAWGGTGPARLDRAGFLRVAERVMTRRGVELTPERLRALEGLYSRQTA